MGFVKIMFLCMFIKSCGSFIKGLSRIKIQVYEYGKSVRGEVLSYVYTGVIQPLQTYYAINATPILPGVQSTFTYLRVHYAPTFPKVLIEFNPNTSHLEFYIKYPFSIIAYGVDAYSLPSFQLDDIFRNNWWG